jgi:hypothetical protein
MGLVSTTDMKTAQVEKKRVKSLGIDPLEGGICQKGAVVFVVFGWYLPSFVPRVFFSIYIYTLC